MPGGELPIPGTMRGSIDIFTPRGNNVRDLNTVKQLALQQAQQQREAELAKTADEISILLQYRNLPPPPPPEPDLAQFVPSDLPPPPPVDLPIPTSLPPPPPVGAEAVVDEDKERKKEEKMKALREQQLMRATLRKSAAHQLQ